MKTIFSERTQFSASYDVFTTKKDPKIKSTEVFKINMPNIWSFIYMPNL